MKREEILLSLQRALVGEVFPTMYRVDVEWTDSSVEVTCYVDNCEDLDPQDQESLNTIETELTADMPTGVNVLFKIHSTEQAKLIGPNVVTAFMRRGQRE